MRETLKLLGLPTSSSPPQVVSYLLVPVLFTGPLFATLLDAVSSPGSLLSQLQEWIGEFRDVGLVEVRNYVVVGPARGPRADPQGPVTEELVFRSCVIASCVLCGASTRWMVFGTPLWFGIGAPVAPRTDSGLRWTTLIAAHAHHALEAFRTHGGTLSAAIRAIFGASECRSKGHCPQTG